MLHLRRQWLLMHGRMCWHAGTGRLVVVSLRSAKNLRPCLCSRPDVTSASAACVPDDHAASGRAEPSGCAGGHAGTACASDRQAACAGSGLPDRAGEKGVDASTSATEAEEHELLGTQGAERMLVVPAYEFAILECLHCSSSEPSQPSFFIYTLQPVDASRG